MPRDTVLSIGRIYCDLVFTGLDHMPKQGSEVFAEALTPTLGGGALIVAGQCAALGRRSALVSRYGTDRLSVALEDLLEGIDVDLSYLERAADAGPQVTVAMVEGTERAFLSRRAGSVRAGAHLHLRLPTSAQRIYISPSTLPLSKSPTWSRAPE